MISSSGSTGGRGSKGNPGRPREGDSGARSAGPDSEQPGLGVGGQGCADGNGTRWLRTWAPACLPRAMGAGLRFSLLFWPVFPLCSSIGGCVPGWLFPGLCSLQAARRQFTDIPARFPRCALTVSSPGQLTCLKHTLFMSLIGFFCLFNNISNICIKLFKTFYSCVSSDSPDSVWWTDW